MVMSLRVGIYESYMVCNQTKSNSAQGHVPQTINLFYCLLWATAVTFVWQIRIYQQSYQLAYYFY